MYSKAHQQPIQECGIHVDSQTGTDTKKTTIRLATGMPVIQGTIYPSGWNHHVQTWDDIDGLVQERRNSSALAMELRLSCTNPSTCILNFRDVQKFTCDSKDLLKAVNFNLRLHRKLLSKVTLVKCFDKYFMQTTPKLNSKLTNADMFSTGPLEAN